MVTEKENGFNVVLRWRYEETAFKIVQLKKKVVQLSSRLQSEEVNLKKSKERYEKLLNFRGDGEELFKIWGVDSNNPKSLERMNSQVR